MSTHTPGPWTMGERDHRGTIPITAKRRDDVVAEVSDPRYADGGEANARLIAAAPDLLAAAQLTLDLLNELESGGAENFAEQEALRAAIAKATRETR